MFAWFRSRHLPRCFTALLVLWLAAGPAWAQQIIEPPAQEESQPSWQPPDLADLPLDWWVKVDAVSPEITGKRMERFLEPATERIQGLDPQSLLVGQASLENLKNLTELLLVAEQTEAETEFEPIPTQNSYFLGDVLALREQAAELDKDRVQTTLEIEQTERKVQLLSERRDRLLRRYQASAKESPERLLTALERVTARVESEIEVLRMERLGERLKLIEERIELLEEQESYARQLLDAGDATIEEKTRQLVDAKARLVEANEKLAALQKQLLDVITADQVKASLQVLRNQQLTRSSAGVALAELEVALAQAELDWYLLRDGSLGADFDYGAASAESRRLSEEILKQIDVWFSASQATLVARLPEDNANAQANFQIAQTVARETLILIERIRDVSADLLLVRDILSTDFVAAQSGLSQAWARLGLATGEFFQNVGKALDYNLFSMGDAPVTPGGLIKMVLILLLAWGVSWFIRHLLERLGNRQQFANSPAIYTLGRLAHYITITIGVFAALASIGIDFSNFALIAGALSVGIGFGLQAIVNNFVSGLILLFEGSLRVGDHIELDSGLAGVVREINTRATVVNTTDGVDVVVPNSELVTTKLTNWTLRESMARVRIGFGVAYGTDKDKVREAGLEAAKEMEFVILNMPGREPQVRLVNFGDSSLDFELLAWVSRQGVRRPHRVRASFLWALETKLAEAGIEIPFPQRDLHIRSDDTR